MINPMAQKEPERQQRLKKLRSRWRKERDVRAWWMSRLRRTFRAVEKTRARVARLEKQLALTESS